MTEKKIPTKISKIYKRERIFFWQEHNHILSFESLKHFINNIYVKISIRKENKF